MYVLTIESNRRLVLEDLDGHVMIAEDLVLDPQLVVHDDRLLWRGRDIVPADIDAAKQLVSEASAIRDQLTSRSGAVPATLTEPSASTMPAARRPGLRSPEQDQAIRAYLARPLGSAAAHQPQRSTVRGSTTSGDAGRNSSRWPLVALVVVLVVAVAAVGVLAATRSGSDDDGSSLHTVRGALTLSSRDCIFVNMTLADGSQLLLRNGSGALIAQGSINGSGRLTGLDACSFPFTIEDVPEEPLYVLESELAAGQLTHTMDELAANGWVWR